MRVENISQKSHIVAKERLDETYFGKDLATGEEPIASHLILVPANKITPPRAKENGKVLLSPNEAAKQVSIHNYLLRKCFEHESELVGYRNQLEEKFGSSPPFAVISKGSAEVFVREYDSFKIGKIPYDHIVRNWCFNRELGNGNHFLQLAYVDYEMTSVENIRKELIDFLIDNPLETLSERSWALKDWDISTKEWLL
jgi:hypothetical protein